MRNRILVSLVVGFVIILNIGCKDNPTGAEHESDLEFSKMEIHYTKSGGWINTSKLDIYGYGLVDAYLIKHASYEILDRDSILLVEEEKKKVADLFESFSAYDSYYAPEEFLTDQNFYTIVLTYEGETDTVTVYMPEQSDIPDGLKKIIDEMEILWHSVFE